MASNEPPIIIKKIVKGGHGHHGGSWKVAYADFVTAMMALFIVLWVIGQDKPVKQAIAMYFTDPSLTAEEISIKLAQGAEAAMPIDEAAPEGQKPREEREERLKLLAKKVKSALESASWKQKLEGQIVIEMTDEGLRIELLDYPNAPFFQVSSAVPTERTRVALKAIASQIRDVDNPIALEGHTDGRPFMTKGGYGNWELSSERANAARRLLLAGGVPEGRVSAVRGYADTRLRVKSDPYDARNRRISIVIKLDEKEAPPAVEKPHAPESEGGHGAPPQLGAAPEPAVAELKKTAKTMEKRKPSSGQKAPAKAHRASPARTSLRGQNIR